MMAAEISNEPRTVVWWEMDLIEGLEYVMLWYQKHQVEFVSTYGQAKSSAAHIII